MLLFLKGNGNGKYVFRTSDNKTIFIKNIETENIAVLEESLNYIENDLNYRLQSFVIDGRKGVIQLLEKRYNNQIPIQLCNFHQVKTILTYTTRNPKTKCGKDLKEFILTLKDKKITENIFLNNFNNLLEKYKDFLKEKTTTNIINKTNGAVIEVKEYTHKRLRSAFRSLKTNLPYLFTYKKQENEHLKIQNTTNACDGKFGAIKGKIKIHRGLKVVRKSAMFNELM